MNSSAFTDPSRFWLQWLGVVLSATLLMGLAFVIVPGLTEKFFDWMIFSGPRSRASFSPEAREYSRFVYGVLGAVIAGWAALMIAIVRGPLARGERWAWQALVLSFGGWFLVDTGHSLSSGYWENAVFNGAFLLPMALPLAKLRKSLHR